MTEPNKPRRGGISLGRIASVPIVLAYSWFLIAAYVVVVFGPRVSTQFPAIGVTAYLVAFAYAILLMLSVLVHELAHALSARAFGWPTDKIVLTLWGGHTQFSGFVATPGRSVIMAMAGPAANAVIAFVGWLILPLFDPGSVGSLLVNILVWANILIAAFNVLPGLPLDGGRMVESLVWKATGSQHKGTIAAGWAGRVIVVVMVLGLLVVPLLRGGAPDLTVLIITLLVGGFMWMGASSAIYAAHIYLRVDSTSVRALMQAAVGVPMGASVLQAEAAGSGVPAVVLLDDEGRPTAILDNVAAQNVPVHLRATTPSSAAARTLADDAVLMDWQEGPGLVAVMTKLDRSEYAIVGDQRQVVGVLYQAAVVAAVKGQRNPVHGQR
ncbi:site-2 protease family protein [Arthrobacter roseus]|uniref:site-2 protease family protein n=1 Tax=Arthrobacter roseus TaxID=136274 RepID=UPI0019659F45|nr:site-2 protease family protein [Arthrobacter roseus]MBM7848550.1 Zn-dependent protease [Arthrobacter roseus]